MPSSIPVLDYSRRDDPSWVRLLSAACRDWGCFQLVSHPFSQSQTTHLLTSMKQFFALPKQDKYAIERTEKNPWGYYDRELTKNIRDWKEILDIGPPANNGPFLGAKPQWPASMPDLKDQLEEYFRGCEALSLFLLKKIAESLNTPAAVFTGGFAKEASSFLRLNYYPVCDEPDHHLGISPHSDSGALTVLFADQKPGLQFWHANNWHTVIPEPDALLVNIGDIVQVWSNDVYTAPLHRVLANKDAARYSAPFFLNPSYDYTYAPVLNEITGDTPLYSAINWGEFRHARAIGDYRDEGEEVQISHFKN